MITTLNQINFDPYSKHKSISHAFWHENQGSFDPDSEPSHFRPPHKTKSILIPTLESSQLRSSTLKSLLSRQPHNNQVTFDAKPKIMSFTGRDALRVIHISTCSCDPTAIRTIYSYECQVQLFLMFPYYYKTPKNIAYLQINARSTIFRTLLHGI